PRSRCSQHVLELGAILAASAHQVVEDVLPWHPQAPSAGLIESALQQGGDREAFCLLLQRLTQVHRAKSAVGSVGRDTDGVRVPYGLQSIAGHLLARDATHCFLLLRSGCVRRNRLSSATEMSQRPANFSPRRRGSFSLSHRRTN